MISSILGSSKATLFGVATGCLGTMDLVPSQGAGGDYLDVPERKLGSLVRINGLFHLLINGVYWGYKPLILTIDPNFLGHPSSGGSEVVVTWVITVLTQPMANRLKLFGMTNM